MRYLIAMAVAIVAALLVTLFVSPQLADLVVDRFTFEGFLPPKEGARRTRRLSSPLPECWTNRLRDS